MGKGVFLNVSAAGHVIPTLGLVAELVRRGEEIVYFELPRFQLELEALGANFRSYPPIQPYPGPGGDNQYFLAPVLTWRAREWAPPVLEAVSAERPDYIVHDSLCLWGRIVAHVLGVPAVASVATAAFCPASLHGCPRLRAMRRELIAEAREGLWLFRDWRRELQTRYGIRPIALVDTFTNRQPLNICYLPRELQPYADAYQSDGGVSLREGEARLHWFTSSDAELQRGPRKGISFFYIPDDRGEHSTAPAESYHAHRSFGLGRARRAAAPRSSSHADGCRLPRSEFRGRCTKPLRLPCWRTWKSSPSSPHSPDGGGNPGKCGRRRCSASRLNLHP